MDGSGNLGIGTTVPGNLLSISGSVINVPLLNLTNLSTGNINDYTQMGYTGTGRTYYTGVGNATETYHGVANKWYLYDQNVDIMRMVVDTAGNVGIGTQSPTGKLSVNPLQYGTGTASQATTTVTGVGTTFTAAMVGSQFVFANGVSAGTITAFGSATSLTVTASQTVASQAYAINYSALNVTTAGKVGVGTTAPAFPFVVQTPGSGDLIGMSSVANTTIYMATNNTSLGLAGNIANRLGFKDDFGTYGGDFLFESNKTGGSSLVTTESMRLTRMGNLGIGTMAPSGKLSVNPSQYAIGTASQGTTTITGVGTTFTAAMVGSQFVFANGVSAGIITAFGSATSLTVSVSQTVTSQGYSINYSGLNVTSTGSVGIGTTSPGSTLDVSESSAATSLLSGVGMRISNPNTTNNNYASLRFATKEVGGNPAPVGTIGTIITSHADTTVTGEMYFATSNSGTQAERVRISSTGNVGIGITNPGALLDVAGTVKLGATGTAFTASGACSISTFVLTTTAQTQTCTGIPASTAVAVTCSPSGAFSTPANAVSARANGTANTISMITVAANSTTLAYTCMWIQP
jgi:TolB-like protein